MVCALGMEVNRSGWQVSSRICSASGPPRLAFAPGGALKDLQHPGVLGEIGMRERIVKQRNRRLLPGEQAPHREPGQQAELFDGAERFLIQIDADADGRNVWLQSQRQQLGR